MTNSPPIPAATVRFAIKMKSLFVMILILFCINCSLTQTREERITKAECQISKALLTYGNRSIALDSDVAIIDVDSSIGNMGIADGRITDPFGTLKSCFLFAAYDSSVSAGGETIGVFKNDSILWLSANFLIETDARVGAQFWGALDLNNDKSVDIILTGGHGILG